MNSLNWTDGNISDCIIKPLSIHSDSRGWLAEVFRHDELETEHLPEMAYISSTLPGTTRGPHEHVSQTDLFAFFSGHIRLYLWDARKSSESFGTRMIITVGEENPAIALVPPGVVHAYKNIGPGSALILNCPNKLYAGPGRSEPVDEIRHEEQTNSIFLID